MTLLGRLAPLTTAAIVGFTLGCTTGAPPPENAGPGKAYVSSIELSLVHGEVGQPFKSDVVYHSRELDEVEYSLSSLPPGLGFDEKTRAIIGVPRAAGFYTVTVAVRKERADTTPRFATPEDGWSTETFEIAIYEPIKEVAGGDPIGSVADLGDE